MNKSKLTGILFVILGILVIAISTYLTIAYASDMLNAIVEFVTTNDFSKLEDCGVTPSSLFLKLKNELANLILPSLYVGFPLLLAIISVLMFLGGFYYHRGKQEEEMGEGGGFERAMIHKVVKRLEKEHMPRSPPILPEPKKEMPTPKKPKKK